MRLLTTGAAAVAMVVFSGAALAQDAGDEGKVIVPEPDSTRAGPAHENYQPIIGEWVTRWTLFNPEGEATKEFAGTASNEWIVGGRWVQSTFKTDLDLKGELFHGVGFFGHDNATGRYHNLWLESNRTAVQYDKGSYDAEARTFTFEGEQPGPDGTLIATRTTMRIDAADRHTIELFVPGVDGVEFRVLEIVLTRRDDSADAEEVAP
ncbi:MAG: DUF1579 family protein [Planctomycetes bacterium]|nr:DUF1579 family protein [Planctomycetota bacterium]